MDITKYGFSGLIKEISFASCVSETNPFMSIWDTVDVLFIFVGLILDYID